MEKPGRIFWLLALAPALALGGCGKKDSEKSDLESIDARLGGKTNADPALTQALEDQIMVDPNLTQQSNQHSIRPPDAPAQTQIPPDANSAPGSLDPARTLGAVAAEQAGNARDRFQGCQLDVAYSPQYANRLPAELPLYPKAQVSEAAGSDAAGCQLRAVTFATNEPPAVLANFYRILAQRGGYSASTGSEDGGTLVSGTRDDGAAFYVILRPLGKGSSGDLVTNRGR
jgi:hypothetical protein